MNGIEEKYSEDVQVMRLNANQGKGQEAFRFYRLQGHPAFVLLGSQSEALWSGLGVINTELLETQVENYLSIP